MRSTSAFAFALLALFAAPARADLLAGVAEGDVTPEIGTPLAGYGARLRLKEGPDLDPRTPAVLFQPSTGVRDPIEAQALALESDGTLSVLVAIDAIGIEDDLARDIARAAKQRGVPLDPDRLFMCGSHTHSGPGSLSRRPLWALSACDLFSRRVHARLVDQVAGLIHAAWSARVPARVGDASGQAPGTIRNRRAGKSAFVKEEDVDPTLRLLRIDDAARGAPLALVLGFPVHGTCLGEESLEFSADVPGAIRRAVRAATGVPTLFLNGAEGDVAPRPGGERGLVDVPARLVPLATDLLAQAAPRAGVPPRVEVSGVWRDLGPPVLHPGLGDSTDLGEYRALGKAIAGALRLVDGRLLAPLLGTRYRLAVLRVGDLALLGVPGEPITAVGHDLEAMARAAGWRPWVVGLANGHAGYVTTPAEYDQGGYEAWLTFFGRDEAARIEAGLREALGTLER